MTGAHDEDSREADEMDDVPAGYEPEEEVHGGDEHGEGQVFEDGGIQDDAVFPSDKFVDEAACLVHTLA